MRKYINLAAILAEAWNPNDPAALLAYAKGEEGHIYSDNEPGGGAASKFTWRFEGAYPINKTIDGLTPTERIAWMKDEIVAHAEDGRPEQYDWLLHEDIRDPVVAVEVGGQTYLWDGNHRVGASLMTGRTTLPAVVGTPKRKRH